MKIDLYAKAINEGAKVLKNNNVVREFLSKDGKKISQTIFPNSDFTTDILVAGKIVKQIERYSHGSSTSINTWDYAKKEGRLLNRVVLDENSFLQRIFKKTSQNEADPHGTITLYKKGQKPTPYDTIKIKELYVHTIAKDDTFNILGEFIKRFWR